VTGGIDVDEMVFPTVEEMIEGLLERALALLRTDEQRRSTFDLRPKSQSSLLITCVTRTFVMAKPRRV